MLGIPKIDTFKVLDSNDQIVDIQKTEVPRSKQMIVDVTFKRRFITKR